MSISINACYMSFDLLNSREEEVEANDAHLRITPKCCHMVRACTNAHMHSAWGSTAIAACFVLFVPLCLQVKDPEKARPMASF